MAEHKPVIGLKAPGHVYSATLRNSSDEDVSVEIQYAGSEDSHGETVEAKIASGAEHAVDEKEVSTGTHQQRKYVKKVTVKKQDGTTKVLEAPFEGVTSPQKNWQFVIDNDGIKSQK
ncbi:unnamed protein product [Didymodactylos carnosus]|uniref:Uncharacterized protein n=2 Tax=Didymodactylos carnosus TaxID=1234261 RepID=A0A815YWY6_9BILA|nr:unnamed protein product [Didymodactylos carnosus]CAF4441377.1 unnamed protein product [Didymodactylos carnosus]